LSKFRNPAAMVNDDLTEVKISSKASRPTGLIPVLFMNEKIFTKLIFAEDLRGVFIPMI